MAKTDDFKNQRSDKFSLVLYESEVPLLKSAKNIVSKLEENIWTLNFIACIKHDQDINEETKQLKTIHYHLVVDFNGNYRVGTIMNWLTDIFHINENQISIQKCTSLEMQTRYLCHVDDFDKYQYDPQDIVSSDLSKVRKWYEKIFIKDLEDCVQAVKRRHYDLETIMTEVANYDKWRKYINDLIINHQRQNRY